MRRVRQWGWAVIGLWCFGCQGPATDVGNPTVNPTAPAQTEPGPSIQQLIGGYAGPAAAGSPPSSDGDTETPAQSTTPSCQVHTGASISMVNGDASTILLDHFFSYGPSTQQVMATYNAAQGILTIGVHDEAVDMTCTGTVQQSNAALTIQFVCDLDKPIDEVCTTLFTKQ